MKKRFVSILLTICTLLTVFTSVPMTAFAEESVSRSQWISSLVQTFSMQVEDDAAMPDNYFGDMAEEHAYYNDILLAVEFGVIHLAAGEDFCPDDAATREFAAQTLNSCLEFRLSDDAEYTYTEADIVAFPEDLQVAANRGWFALTDAGNILPEQPITQTEADAMLADAQEVLESSIIEEEYESTYDFAENVVVIPEGTQVAIAEDYTVTVTDYETGLNPDDIFVVFSDKIPVALKALEVTVADNSTTITATPEGAEGAITSVDSQGVTEIDLEDFKAEEVETFSVTNTETNATENLSISLQGIDYNFKTKTLTASKEIAIGESGAGSISVEISNLKLHHKEDTRLGNYEAYITAKTVITKSISFDFGNYVGLPSKIVLGYVPLEGIGDIRLEVTISLKGGITETEEGKITAGFAHSRAAGFRLIKGYQKTDYSFVAEAEVSIGMTLSLNIQLVVVEGRIWATVGVKGHYQLKDFTRVDNNAPHHCETIKSYLYANVGVSATINYILDKETWSKVHEIYNEKNSPARTYYHYEDGKLVAACTRGKDNNEAYTRYTTKLSSRYFNPGPGYSSGSYTDADGSTFVLWDYELDDENHATITAYNGNATALAIPSTLDGYTVTAIGRNVFYDRTALRSVTIPNSITTIGDNAFHGCSNLSNVKMPESIVKMGNSVFAYCEKLTSVHIPATLKEVGYYASFEYCDSLKTVTFGKGITTIPTRLFANCTGLEEITIPDTVTEIGNRAFDNCSNLRTVIIPDSVVTIGDSAFANCENLTNVTMSKNIVKIGNSAFAYCTSLAEIFLPATLEEAGYYGIFENCSSLKTITFGEDFTKIPNRTFVNCSGIEEITIPDTVTEIGSRAFESCSNLRTVIIPDSVVTIGDNAFADCANLTNVTMSKYVVKIGNSAFANCKSLTAIFLPATLKEVGYYGIFENCSSLKTVTFGENFAKVPNRLFSGCTGIEEITLPDTVTEIGNRAFENCTALTTFTMTDNVTTLDNHVWSGCERLENINLSKQITHLPDGTFYGCASLKEFIIPDTVTKLGIDVFGRCSGLEKISFPDSYTTIPDSTCNGCKSLKEVHLPKNLRVIRHDAFYGCSSLNTIALPEQLQEIHSNAFYESGLKELTIPAGVTRIDAKAFYNCDALVTANIDAYTSLGAQAFEDCDALLTVTIKGFGEIEHEAFSECDALTSLTIGDKVTRIGDRLCYGCDKLTTVSLGKGIIEIPDSAFRLCKNLQTVTIPRFCTTIAENAFAENTKLKSAYIPTSVTNIDSTSFSYPHIMSIYGKADSYAQEYSTEWGFPFVAENTPITTLAYPENSMNIPMWDEILPDMQILPGFDTDTVTFTSDNEDIVTVSANGTLFGRDYGTATVKMASASGLSDTIEIHVIRPAYSVTLNKESMDLAVGDFETLTTTLAPHDTTDIVAWTSDNTAVAIVDENGKVTAVGKGTATITAAATFGSGAASCRITVVDADVPIVEVTGITLNKTEREITIGKTYKLVANVLPENATNKLVEWISSDPSVADVKDGVVTAKSIGTATITAKTVSGSFTSECRITVVPKVEITGFTAQVFRPNAFITLNAVNAPENAVVYVASYNDAGKMLELQTLTLTNGLANTIISTADVAYYKAFIWKEELLPISEPKILHITVTV